jgi:hypothetical protein
MSVFKVGKATVTRIEETYLPIYPVTDIFPAVTETQLAEHAHWLGPHHYDPASRKIKLSVHSWLLPLDGRKILIDGRCGRRGTCSTRHGSTGSRQPARGPTKSIS